MYLAILVVVADACSSRASRASNSAAAPHSLLNRPALHATTPPCRSGQLRLTYRYQGASTVSLHGYLVLRNDSDRTCQVRGFPRIAASWRGATLRVGVAHQGPVGAAVSIGRGHPAYVFLVTSSVSNRPPFLLCPNATAVDVSLPGTARRIPLQTRHLHGKRRAVLTFCNHHVVLGPVQATSPLTGGF
jgi:hypothetical protein